MAEGTKLDLTLKECNICGSDIAEKLEYCPECGTDFTDEFKYNY